MKQLILAVLITFALTASAQDSINIEMVSSVDSSILFTFRDTLNNHYTVEATGGYWRNGDFVFMYLDYQHTEAISFIINGKVTTKHIKRKKQHGN